MFSQATRPTGFLLLEDSTTTTTAIIIMALVCEFIKIEPSSPSAKSKCGDIYAHSSGNISLVCGFCEAIEFFTLVEYSDHHFKCHFSLELDSSVKPEEPSIGGSASDGIMSLPEIHHVTSCEIINNINSPTAEAPENPLKKSPSISKQLKIRKEKMSISKQSKRPKTSKETDYWRQPPFGYLPSYTCDFCKIEVISKRKLFAHMYKVHSFGYGCTFCGKQLSSSSSLTRHEKSHKLDSVSKSCFCNQPECDKCELQIPKCDFCDLVFLRRCKLRLHMWTTHSIGFPCRVCGRHFMLKHNRKSHEETHAGKRPFQCEYCPSTFTLRTSLNDHTKLHTGERPFLCTICGKGFVSNAKLNGHAKRVHPAQPIRFTCSICGTELSNSYHLRRHKEKQHNIGVHICTCDICKRVFTNRKCLVQHMKIHTGMKPYKCRYCDMTFAQAAGKRGHERNKHEDVSI